MRDRARRLRDRVGSLERRYCVSLSCALFAGFVRMAGAYKVVLFDTLGVK